MRLHDGRPGGTILIVVPGRGVEGAPVGQECPQRAHDLGRLVETAQEFVGIHAGRCFHRLPPAVDQDEAGTSWPQVCGGHGRDDRPEPMPRQDHPLVVGEGPGAFRGRDRVVGQDRERIGAVLGRGVGKAMAAQVHRDGRNGSGEPARDRSPDPCRLRQAVDEEDTNAPVERIAA